MMLPKLLTERMIHPFNFYVDGEVRPGMRYQSDLYGLFQEFKLEQRLDIYPIATELLQKGIPIVVTAFQQRYRVWVKMRSPTTLNPQLSDYQAIQQR